MTLFPLYDSLLDELNSTKTKKDLTVAQKKSLIVDISNLDIVGTRHVLALIRCHQLITDTEKASVSLPYEGKVSDDELTFDLTDLPIELRHILNLFVKKHASSMEETNRLNNMRI